MPSAANPARFGCCAWIPSRTLTVSSTRSHGLVAVLVIQAVCGLAGYRDYDDRCVLQHSRMDQKHPSDCIYKALA